MVIRALGFDVFGTVVDWRTSVAREVTPLLAGLGRNDVSGEEFATAWRSRYNPAMEEVRSGRRREPILADIPTAPTVAAQVARPVAG